MMITVFTPTYNRGALLRRLYESLLAQTVYDFEVAKVSVVGAGMATHAGVAAKIFEALYNTGINIRMISTSEIRVSVLIDETDADRAARAIHEAFELEGLNR